MKALPTCDISKYLSSQVIFNTTSPNEERVCRQIVDMVYVDNLTYDLATFIFKHM